MATVTSPTGAFLPEQRFFSVDIDTVITESGTTYRWQTQQGSALGNVISEITLVGSFTYPGGVPTGSVAQIRIDSDGDGNEDLTIAFSSLQAILPDLTSGNDRQFWTAAFAQNDTFTLAGAAVGFILGAYSSANGVTYNDDTGTITGSGTYTLDSGRFGYGQIGGNDTADINSSNPDLDVTVYGDASGTYPNDPVTGGADVIEDISASGTGTVRIFGDFRTISNDITNGGKDTLTANNRQAILFGDVDQASGFADTLNGGDDTLTGGDLDDVIYGDLGYTSAFNTVTLNAGDDVIDGGGGNDIIYGDYGLQASGVLVVTGGDDTIQGGNGDDIIYGQSGNDILDGGSHNDVLFGGTGNDTIDGNAGVDTANFSLSLFAVTVVLVNFGDGSATGNGTDILRNIENIVGTDLNDSITANFADNILEGGGGNDYIDGDTGDDTASYASAPSGVTVDLAIQGTSQPTGGAGDDTLVNIDNLIGSDHADTLFGSTATNRIYAGGGHDIVLLGSGMGTFPAPGNDNEVYGEGGNDTIGYALTGVGQSNVGANQLFDGGSGFDTFVFETFGQDYTVNLATGAFIRNSSGIQIATLVDIENVSAGSGDDQLTGNDGDNTLDGGAGVDTMTGGLGNDTYYLDQASDTVVELPDEGFDRLYASFDFTVDPLLHPNIESFGLLGSATQLNGDGLDNRLIANPTLGSTLNGFGGEDILEGQDGPDRLDGGLGDDQMRGNGGNDIYIVAQAGDQVIEFSNGGSLDTVYAYVDFTLDANTEILVMRGAATSGTGGAGFNRIYGTANADTINAMAGDDVIYAGGGNDMLFGGPGNDRLDGGPGADTMTGGTENDVYIVNAAGDTVVELPGEGIDSIYSYVDYTASANVENLILRGAARVATGNAEANSLAGTTGNDTLTGLAGNDKLFGKAGNDTLDGGADNDRLYGDRGQDTMTGGTGLDQFFFRETLDSSNQVAFADVITDFTQAEFDRINLTEIDADETNGAGTNEAFSFIGTAAFSAPGQVRYEQVGGDTHVFGNTDADIFPEFAIVLTGTITLTSGDFFL